ncbi:MAG TPA: hypothetical protein VM450_09720 [Thermomicrobiales bacterium]|nr:hypothetical protein [Thermomicrobiales bacterium]
MTYRDPLYDTGSTSDVDPLDQTSPQGTNDTSAVNPAQQKTDEIASQMGDTYKQAADTARQKGEEAKQKASEVGHRAQDKADEGMDKAAAGLGQAADKLRAQGEQHGGTMATAATRTADSLDSASHYLRDKDTDQLLSDLEALVRRKPVESMLAAAGIGFLLSRLVR